MAKEREENYFAMFCEASSYACTASKQLVALVTDYTDVERKVEDLHTTEHTADGVFRKLVKQLNRSFITPIEREDIFEIASSIDDVVDRIEKVAQILYMLNVKEVPADVVTFVEYIVRATNALYKAVEELEHFKKSKDIENYVKIVNDIEDEGDVYYQKTVHNLFASSADPVQLQVWREIYHNIEDCLDACEDVADTIDGVILKNS